MDLSETGPRYVLDATTLINFERSSDLKRLPPAGVRLFIPDRVAREVNRPQTRLETWLKRHPRLVTAMLPEESRLYLELIRQPEIHDGEAAALAIASRRQAQLVTDDIAAQRKAAAHTVECLSTVEFRQRAIPTQLRFGDT